VFGQGAEFALGEALGGDGEGTVEAGAVVFPGNCGRQFDEFALGKVIAQRSVEFVGDRGGSACHVGGEAKDELFAFVKVRAGLELGEVVKLCLSDTLFSADGRVDVDSKGTANHHGDLELRELFQAHRNGARGSGVKIHAHNIPQEFGIASADPQAKRYATDTAFCEPKDDAG
jgi:hypothetical protein